MAKTAIEKAEKEILNIDEDCDENKDYVDVYNYFKENLDIWVSEEEGEP